MRSLLVACLFVLPLSGQEPAPAGKESPLPKVGEFAAKMQRQPGFLELVVDAAHDRIYLLLTAFDVELLYATAHASGLGANPIGLDRGSLGPQHVITFRRAGDKVLVMAMNLDFRALSTNAREREAVAESFAPAVLAALPVKAEQAGQVLVDATAFFLRDATGTAARLSAGGANYRLDASRSALWLPRTKAFVDNTEVEVLLTFASDRANPEVARTAAVGDAVTLRQHHSFVRLPDDGYRPRAFDARVGYFGPQFADYAAPIGATLQRHYIARHRLQKKDPAAAVSEPIEPIVYYIDPGTPEPVRSALRDGAMWWAAAFEAAGFKDAFRVEMLPDDADPMDVRFNMIHWVHRQTRGWSYGSSISDPRTGEIIKGNVLLGSLRVRQDHLKLVGLQSPFGGAACAVSDAPGASHLIADDAQALAIALARIRQLAAHEVGHTLGLSHNFAASSYGRASVMDYPAPFVQITEAGALDFSAAYAEGIGAYDKWAITYGYAQFPPQSDEAAELAKVVQAGLAKGYAFLTDQDARADGTAHPLASLWDNGDDAIEQLELDLRVRKIALRKFGLDALRPGASLAQLEDTLVPLYLHHRFQLEAAMKFIGGVDFRHAQKEDGQVGTQGVPATRQYVALQLALMTLRPEFLQLDPRLVRLIPPAPPGHPRTAERFAGSTGQLLDPVALAVSCADITLLALLHAERAARLENRGDGGGLSFEEILRSVEDTLFEADASVTQRAVQAAFVDRLMELADERAAAVAVRERAEESLLRIASNAAASETLRRRIQVFASAANRSQRSVPRLPAPPGSPIGSGR